MSKTLIELTNISKSFNGKSAIKDISLEIYENEVFGIIGANGAGKTTTLNLLLNLIKPTSGFIRFSNIKNRDMSGYLDSTGLDPSITVYDNLRLICFIKSVNFQFEINQVSTELGINELLNLKFGSLSFGQKQKVLIASSLIGNPKIIILDEPTNGLDPMSIVNIREIILRRKNASNTIIIASHMLTEMEKICDRVAIFVSGNLKELGELKDINHKYGDLEKALISFQ
jgi:ABC-2 type transport system ATP-binding protein